MRDAEGLEGRRKRVESRGPGESVFDVLTKRTRQLWPSESRAVKRAKVILALAEKAEDAEIRAHLEAKGITDYKAVRDYLRTKHYLEEHGRNIGGPAEKPKARKTSVNP